MIHSDEASMPPWPNGAAVSQVCFTRATCNLESLLAFYRDGLGLAVLFQFDGGAMLGLPGRGHHLELLRVGAGECSPPGRHNVMVLHIPGRADAEALAARLRARGCSPVAPANPYWAATALVFEDPDGWPVVINHGDGLAG
jgi:catechol-2,3-dioxygenase